MADLTVQGDITGDWTNVRTLLSLDQGTTYLLDLVSAEANAIVWLAFTDNTTAPTVTGHPWHPTTQDYVAVSRQVTVTSGVYIWARVDRGIATMVATRT